MSITTTRSIIDIGTSKGITLPAKELKRLGICAGDEVRVTVTLLDKPKIKNDLNSEYALFTQQYGETLKNLADR